MHLEEFAEGNSYLHRLDPRVKILTLTPFIFVIALVEGIKVPLAGLIVSVILTLSARLSLKKVINRLMVVNVFIVMLWIFVPFTSKGDVLIDLGSIGISKDGLLYVLSITLKTNAIVLGTIALLGTSHVFNLAHALIHMKAPAKLVHLFFFFYRYISVLHDEYSRLRRAMAIRAFKPGTNLHTYRSYAYLIGMLIVSSYERSRRIYNAMLCRGFKGKFPIVNHFKLNKTDLIFGIFMTSITIALILIYRGV